MLNLTKLGPWEGGSIIKYFARYHIGKKISISYGIVKISKVLILSCLILSYDMLCSSVCAVTMSLLNHLYF